MENILKRLQAHEVFANLDEVELRVLLPILERKSYAEGAVVFEAGQIPGAFFFIESGTFSVQLTNNE